MTDSRLAFDIMARDDGASAVFDKVARSADRTGLALKKTGKISDEVAKSSANLTKVRHAETDALDKVQVAESKLSDARQAAQAKVAQVKAAEQNLLTVRNNTSSSTSQIAAAESKLQNARNSSNTSNSKVLAGEKALAKARREAAVAGNLAQKAAKELGQVLDVEGKKAGKGGALRNWFTGGAKDFKAAGQQAASGFSGGVLAGLKGTLATPTVGPIVAAVLIAAVESVAVPVGAVLAGGIVAGFGAGIGALGIVFAAKSVAVKNAWNRTLWSMAADMRIISKPFESTLLQMAAATRRTFATFKPELARAFTGLAPALSDFGAQFGKALGMLAPAIIPISRAFDGVLKSLGPGLQSMLRSVSVGLQIVSQSVAKNPAALADMVKGVGDLTRDLLVMVSVLNDANGAFKRLTGISGVTALFRGLEVAVALALGPFVAIAGGVGKLADLLAQLSGKSADAAPRVADLGKAATLSGGAAADMGAKVAALNAAQGKTADGTAKLAAGLGKSAHETHAANAAALLLAGAYDRQAAATQKANDALSRQSSLLLSLSGSAIAYQQAVDDVTAAIKANGATHDINTQKGRDNQSALNQSAASAMAQIANLRNTNQASVGVAIAAQREYAKQAVQMGYTATEAHRLAQEFIKIPPKVKADFKVDITDLTGKVAAAKRQLADPHLSATKKAKLQADIVQWQAGIAAAKRSLAGLPPDKTAKLLANKADLDAKLAAAKRQLADPHLSATKRAKLEATYAQLQAAVRAAQATINSLHGKTVTNSVVTKYSSTGVNLTTPSSVGRRASGGPVSKGVPYVVGEKRPELFVPNENGTIIPKVPSAAVGQSVAAGMADGARGGAAGAISAAGEIAAGMIAKAREVLGISSPSKAFAKLGLWVNQGFAIGLKGSAKQVQSVMASLMSKVLDISYNAAATKAAISKTIASLNAALAKARDRIKPITHGMTKAQVAAAERSNRSVAASIRAIQAKLKTAKADLANVNSIAARMGTTVKRNAIIGMLQRENAMMQKLANARAAVANQLKAAQAKLAAAVQIRDEFKKSITDAALSFNAITNITGDEGRTLVAQDILAHMQQTLAKTKQFANQLANLKNLGLRGDLYKQIAEAGVDAGGATAAALLQGGKGAVSSANDLQRQIANASAGLGNTAAKNMYQAGVDAAQGLVNGLLAKTKALDAASKKLAAAIVAQIKKTLGIKSPSKVLEWHGAMAGEGFRRGIEGEYGRVQKAAAGLGNAATNIRSTPGGAGTSGQLPLKVELVFKSDGSAHMDQLMRDVRKYVKVNGGNVQQALGSK